MKKPPVRGRTAQPSGMLAKLLGQAATPSTRVAPTLAQAQSLYEAVVALYHRAEWDQAERQADALLALLFRVGSSDHSTARNRGIGLHASRAYLLKMEATIVAENRSDGVAMVIVFPPSEGAPAPDVSMKAA